MELSVPHVLASLPRHLIFIMVVAYCASILPCSVCSTYGNCQNTSICGNISFGYPFGVGNNGCGLPSFQIDCVENSSPVITIIGLNYTILNYYPNNSSLAIVKNENCDFLYDQTFNIGSAFRITRTYNSTLNVYDCDSNFSATSNSTGEKLISECNSTVYYSLFNNGSVSGCATEQVAVDVGMAEWVSNDTKTAETCDSCEESGGICGYNASVSSGSDVSFLCYCEDDKCSGYGKKAMNGAAIGGSVGAAVLIVAGLLVGITFYARRRKPAPPPSSISKVEKFLKEYADEMPTRYSSSHLKKMTNNFAEKLGEGGFGVVYKGKLPNGSLVAVKLLDRHRHSESHQFMNEVATIGRVHHVNLVRLVGYCFESFTSALVYEYMVNGSLEKIIFAGKEKGQVLSWEQLYSIALGAARGIAYLHQDCEKRIIHFDIKPHNILLDADFTPKVSDFGLAKFCRKGDDHISMTAARGTPGYVAPELCDRNLGPVTDKSDVYSFGMFLLEIVGGRRNFNWKVSRSSQFYFPEWAFKMLESGGELGMRLRIEGELGAEDEEKARTLTKVGLWCIQYNYRDRPGMSRVVQMLEGNGSDVANPPLPSNSSGAGDAPENPLLSSTEESCSIEISL